MPLHDQELPELFQLPLDRFTDARNDVAPRPRTTGSADAAAAVKSMPKPPATAWAVNQVYWRHREDFDLLLQAGARVKEAQRRSASGDELRESIREQRGAVQG